MAQALCGLAEEEAKEAEASPPPRLTELPAADDGDGSGDDHSKGFGDKGEMVSWLSLPREPEGQDVRLKRALTEIRVRSQIP